MKKAKYLAPLAVPAMVLTAGFFGSNTYAANTGLRIDVSDNASKICEIYQTGNSPYNSTGVQCDGSYGSYDPETSTLTLGASTTDKLVYIYGVSEDGYITVTTEEETLSMKELKSTRNVIFDSGENTISATRLMVENIVGEGEEAEHPYGDFIVKSGEVKIGQTSHFNDILLDGGILSPQDVIFVDKIEIKPDSMFSSINSTLYVEEEMKVSGGSVDVFQGRIILSGEGSVFTLDDGDVTLKGTNNLNSAGIGSNSGNRNGNQVVNINGGTLTIDSYDYGMKFSYAGKVNFNGGTTTVTNVDSQVIFIIDEEDLTGSIQFGKDMVLLGEGTEVYAREGLLFFEAGIKGNSAKIHYVEGGAPASDGEEESDVKVPDTGASINSEEGGALSIFAVSSFVILSIIALATTFKKRSAGHFKFDK